MTPGEKLLWDMKVTAGARFNASYRLNRKDKFANISLAFYSSTVVSLAIIALAFDLGHVLSKVLSVSSLIALIVILVLSMKMFAEHHAVDAEQMHRCALEVNELRRLLVLENLQEQDVIWRGTERYNSILQKYSINHSKQDYIKYKYSHWWEFDDISEVNAESVARRQYRESRSENLLEKISTVVAGAGFAAAISALLAAVIGVLGL